MGWITHRYPGVEGSAVETTDGLGRDLLPFIDNGTVSLARVDDAATRVLANVYQFNLNNTDRPSLITEFYAFTSGDFRSTQADHRHKIREIGAAGTVLLSNDGILPLSKPKALAIFGSDAGPDPNGANNGQTAGGTVAMGYGSGWTEFPYLISPLEAINARAREDNTWVVTITNHSATDRIDTAASARSTRPASSSSTRSRARTRASRATAATATTSQPGTVGTPSSSASRASAATRSSSPTRRARWSCPGPTTPTSRPSCGPACLGRSRATLSRMCSTEM